MLDELHKKKAIWEPNFLFTQNEISAIKNSKNATNKAGGYLVAKEAFFKATNGVIQVSWYWTDLEIRNTAHGRPYFFTYNLLNSALSSLKSQIDLSISHTALYASGTVIAMIGGSQ
jgi:phosphopantetheine--protein transferase-like protein